MSHRADANRRRLGLALVALPALVGLVLLARGTEREARRSVTVMGTVATVRVWAPRDDQARAGVDAGVRELRRVEALLTSWNDESEVGRINALAPGSSRVVSPELLSLLIEAREWTVRTGGAFEPVVGALVDVWDLRGQGRQPSAEEIAAARMAVGGEGLRVDAAQGTVTRLRDGAWLDAGAFGKGAALRSAADTLQALGVVRAHLDLGGQILVMGEEPATLGVAHPARREDVVGALRVRAASAATSGQSERGVEVGGRRLGHILDPRTGEPVRAWGSVTVVASDAMVADLLATALFVLGPEQGMRLARSLPDVAVLFIEDTAGGLRASFTDSMAPLLVELSEDISGGP